MNALDTQAMPTPPTPGAGPRSPARPNASTLRHRAEVPVLVLCTLLTLGGASVAVVALVRLVVDAVAKVGRLSGGGERSQSTDSASYPGGQ